MKIVRSWKSWTAIVALAGLTTAFALDRPSIGNPPREITVWKSASCGCCGKWVTYMKNKGFKVTVHDMDDVNPVKRQHGVPANLWSCHTAVVDGYVIEGHVPAPDIESLLRDRPNVVGLSVPGMVAGSPGMDGPPQHYDVIAFGDAKTRVFAHH